MTLPPKPIRDGMTVSQTTYCVLKLYEKRELAIAQRLKDMKQFNKKEILKDYDFDELIAELENRREEK